MHMFICVQQWIYSLATTPKGLNLYRTATPADAGYGATVDEYLPPDYFSSHSAEEFYEYVAGKAARCLFGEEAEAEKRALREQLRRAGLL